MVERKPLETTEKLAEVAGEYVSQLREYLKDPERYKPAPSPLKELNKLLRGGFPRVAPFYIVVLGRDKIGKSTFGKHLFMAHLEKTGRKGIIYDLEESKWDTAERALTMRSSTINRSDIYSIEYTAEQLDYLDTIVQDMQDQDLWVNDQTYVLPQMIDDALARGCHDILIDNYQLMLGGSGDLRERLENNSKIIMRARNQHDLTTWLLAQGNEAEYTAGSKQPFKDANYVLEIRGIHQKIPGEKGKGTMLQGIRRGALTRARKATTGEFDMVFDAPYSRVRDVENIPETPVSEKFMAFEDEPDEHEQEYEQFDLFEEERNDDTESD